MCGEGRNAPGLVRQDSRGIPAPHERPGSAPFRVAREQPERGGIFSQIFSDCFNSKRPLDLR
jgi:hypothetical protein